MGNSTFYYLLISETDRRGICGICRFMVRDTYAIKTHIFCSLQAFVKLEFMRSENIISNWYEVQRNLFTSVIREHIFANIGKNIIV